MRSLAQVISPVLRLDEEKQYSKSLRGVMKVADETAGLIVKDLRLLGYDVVPNSQGCKIKLPLWCSVMILFQQDSIRLLPKAGRSPLIASTWGSLLLLIVTFSIVTSNPEMASMSSVGSGIIFFSVIDLVWGVHSYILTESAMSTVRNLVISKYTK
jgi:hypothetical protein